MRRQQRKQQQRKRSANANLGKQLARIEKAVFSEKRYYNVQYGASASTTPTYIQLNAIATGDNDGTREGSRILMDWVRVNCDCTNADSPANIVRLIVYINKTDNGAGPSGDASFLLADPSSYPWISPLNEIYCSGPSRRYVVLKDVIFNPAAAWQPVQRRSMMINLRGLEATYGSTSAVSPGTNSLNIMVLSDSSVVTHPAFLISTQLRYTP